MDQFNLSDFVDVQKAKSIFTKLTNAVMNYTEFQAKVMEATNNEPCKATREKLVKKKLPWIECLTD